MRWTLSIPERFWAKVDKRGPNECWPWVGTIHPEGYGYFSMHSRGHRSHRVAYELLVGPIPEGLQLDHLCRNRACVNPAHLEPVTGAENVRRGLAGVLRAPKTQCVNGHPYTDENTRYQGGKRVCRTCRIRANREFRNRQRASVIGWCEPETAL